MLSRPLLLRARLTRALAGATLLAAMVTATAPGASSSLVVTMDVPSATTITNQCTQSPAWSLGTVLPGTPATTSTGTDVCRIRFSSSNDSSSLRMWQADRENTAMARADAAWDTRSGDTQQLSGIEVGPAGKVITFGGSGTWRLSTNSGSTFPTTGSNAGGDGQTIDDVDVLESTPTVVWASGHLGRIRYSTDGGTTWSLQASGTSEHLYAVLAETTTTAIVGGSGGVVLRTTNTGGSWVPSVSGLTSGINDFARRASNDYWLVGNNNGIRRSSDGGLTWNAVAAAPTPWAHWESVELTGAQTVWVAGDSGGQATISRSTDNGATWQNRSTNLGARLLDMVAISDLEAWVAGMNGTLLHTTDGGVNWIRHDPPSTSTLVGIALATDGTLVIATSNDEVLRTTDGITFTTGYDGNTAVPLNDIDVVENDRRTLVAVGDGGYVRRSTDRGTSWSTIAAVTGAHLNSISLSTERGVGWAVGNGGVILRTADNGATWATQTSPTTEHLLGVDAASDRVAWAVGRTGTVLRTIDGGTMWTTVVSGTTQQLLAISALDANTAWVGGTNGTIRVTTNGGGAWTSRTHSSGGNIYDLHAVDATTVQGANEWPGYFSSTNAGVTWVDGLYMGGRKAVAWERDRPVAMGYYYGEVRYSSDMGASWSDLGNAGTYLYGRGAAAIDANRIVIVGENEIINVSRVRDPVVDYGGAGSTWASPANGLFGVCLQDAGAGATPVWSEDTGNVPGRCEPLAGDIWSAVPQTPTTIATTTLGTDAYVDLVWGVRPKPDQLPGAYTATVSFETIAPAA